MSELIELIDKRELLETVQNSSCAVSPLDVIRDFPVSSYAQSLVDFERFVIEEAYMHLRKLYFAENKRLSDKSLYHFKTRFELLLDILYLCDFVPRFLIYLKGIGDCISAELIKYLTIHYPYFFGF